MWILLWVAPWNTATSKPWIRNLNWWEGPWNIFWKNYWARKYLGLWSPGLPIFFRKICKTLRPPSYKLNVRSLISELIIVNTFFFYSSIPHLSSEKVHSFLFSFSFHSSCWGISFLGNGKIVSSNAITIKSVSVCLYLLKMESHLPEIVLFAWLNVL